jgi:predicted aldo/keto reductase-like oxidoreductase
VPDGVAGLLESSSRKMLPVEWALQWIWSQPEVSLVLSGMSNLDEVRQNIEYASRAEIGLLDEDDESLIDRVRREYRTRAVVPCTQCGYCMPCPSKVEIPHIFDLLNSSVLYDDLDRMRTMYTWINEEKRADRCTSCGECEEKCPQAIPIAQQLSRAHTRLRLRS